MKHFTRFLLILTAVFVTNSHAQKSEKQAQKVVEASLKAMGGKRFLKKINTLYVSGELTIDGEKSQWINKEMLPNKETFEILSDGKTVYKTSFDGSVGYQISNGKKQKVDQAEFEEKKGKKNIFKEFDFLDKTLYSLEYLGEKKSGNTICHEFKATSKNGKIENLYFDKKSGFLIEVKTISDPNSDSLPITYYENYKKFGDLIHFTVMKVSFAGNVQKAELLEIKYNEGVSDKDFE